MCSVSALKVRVPLEGAWSCYGKTYGNYLVSHIPCPPVAILERRAEEREIERTTKTKHEREKEHQLLNCRLNPRMYFLVGPIPTIPKNRRGPTLEETIPEETRAIYESARS